MVDLRGGGSIALVNAILGAESRSRCYLARWLIAFCRSGSL